MNNKYAKYMVFALQIHNGIEENVLLHWYLRFWSFSSLWKKSIAKIREDIVDLSKGVTQMVLPECCGTAEYTFYSTLYRIFTKTDPGSN